MTGDTSVIQDVGMYVHTQVPIYASYLHDAVSVYASALEQVRRLNVTDVSNGTAIMSHIRGTVYQSELTTTWLQRRLRGVYMGTPHCKAVFIIIIIIIIETFVTRLLQLKNEHKRYNETFSKFRQKQAQNCGFSRIRGFKC